MNQQLRTMRLTVQQFFKEYHWQGEEINQTLLEREASLIENKIGLNLSVEDFLRKNNWTGKNLSKSRAKEGKASYLVLSVKQFFQELPWESSRLISNSTKKEKKSEWKVSDLSNLF